VQNPLPLKPHRSQLILILGILSLVVCMPLGILAWILGADDLKAMDAGTMDPGGRSSTEVGKVCGMISTMITAIVLSICVIMFLFGLIAAMLSPHH
jgi:hypothetical protein